MRAAVIAIVLAAACGKKDNDTKQQPPPQTGSGSAVVKPAPPPPPPFTPLSADPGGATGAPVWSVGFGGLAIDAARGIAADPDGAVYVAGHFEGKCTFGPLGERTPTTPTDPKKTDGDAYVAKIDATGKPVWVKTFGAARADAANAIAVGKDHVVAVGNFLDDLKIEGLAAKSSGSDDIFVVGFDRGGTPQWLLTAGGIDSDGANAVAATPDGGWVIGGSFMRSAEIGSAAAKVQLKAVGATDAFLAKLGPTGDLEWAKSFGGNDDDTITRLAVDTQGSIIVQGTFVYEASWGGDKLKAGGGSDHDIVLAKYDPRGEHVWSKRFGSAMNEKAGGVAVDQAGNVTMTGSFDSVVTGFDKDYKAAGESDIVVARFDPAGALQWVRTWGAADEDIGHGVVADASGNVVVTGWFQHKVDFGSGPVTSKGNRDTFVVKLDPDGALVWLKTFGDRDHDEGRAIAIDGAGNPVVAGLFRFKLDLAPAPALESIRAPEDKAPKPDVFVARFAR